MQLETFIKDTNSGSSFSSLSGSIVLIIALVLSVTLFAFSLFKSVADHQTAMTIIDWLFIVGGARWSR